MEKYEPNDESNGNMQGTKPAKLLSFFWALFPEIFAVIIEVIVSHYVVNVCKESRSSKLKKMGAREWSPRPPTQLAEGIFIHSLRLLFGSPSVVFLLRGLPRQLQGLRHQLDALRERPGTRPFLLIST